MKYTPVMILLTMLLAVMLTACVAQPATSAYPTGIGLLPAGPDVPTTSSTSAGSDAPDITLDDFVPVIGEVLEAGDESVLIDDIISGGSVKLLLDGTSWPDKGRPEIKPGWLLSGDTAMGWMKSSPPQAVLRTLNSCVPAVPVEGRVLEAGEDRILIEDADGQQMALLISADTFIPEAVRPNIKAGGTIAGFRAEKVMESWPLQARLLAVKSIK